MLSNVRGVALLGASAPRASASLSRRMRDCFFLRLLFQKVFAVHFAPLEFVFDPSRVFADDSFHFGSVGGFLALETGMTNSWFGWSHDSRRFSASRPDA